jgi:hypothetical protein
LLIEDAEQRKKTSAMATKNVDDISAHADDESIIAIWSARGGDERGYGDRFRTRSRFVREMGAIVRQSRNQSVRNHRANGRTMMMNASVDHVGGEIRRHGIDEALVGLHRTLKRIAKARAHLDVQEAEALREAQRLGLWRPFGHASLADYMVQELGYSSHRVAEDRLRLANALPALPRLSEALQNGDLNFSQARELARVVTPETEKAWIEKAQNLNVRQVEQAVAGHAKGRLAGGSRRCTPRAQDDLDERAPGDGGAASRSEARSREGARREGRRGRRHGSAVPYVPEPSEELRHDG